MTLFDLMSDMTWTVGRIKLESYNYTPRGFCRRKIAALAYVFYFLIFFFNILWGSLPTVINLSLELFQGTLHHKLLIL